MAEIHTEASIIRSLRSYFQNGYNYRINNAYIFAPDWESDFFCVARSGYAIEIEVKISKADFLNDFKKKKHEVFLTGFTTGIYSGKKMEKKFIPNQFYYAVPEGLLTLEDIPEYAGLITVQKHQTTIVKRAPYIHKRKLEVRKVLCDKFYHRWVDERRRNNLLQYDFKHKEEQLRKFKEKYPNEFKTC